MGKKQAFPFSLAHSHSDCPSPSYAPALLCYCKSTYHYSYNVPFKCLCLFSSSLFPGKNPIDTRWQFFSASTKDSELIYSWSEAGFPPGSPKDNCLHEWAAFSMPCRKVLLARMWLFSLGRDWKNVLLPPYADHKNQWVDGSHAWRTRRDVLVIPSSLLILCISFT